MNVLLTTGHVFDKKTKFRAIFVDGTLHELEKEKVDLSGTWVTNLTKDGATRSLQIDADGTVTVIKVTPPAPADPAKPDATEAKEKTLKAKARKVVQDNNTLTYIFDHDDFGDDGIASVAMIFDLSTTPPTATGRVVLPDNSTIQYTAVREPRSLAGDWPMFFDVPDVAHQVGGILKAKDTGKLADKKTTIDIFMTTDDGKQQTVAARDVTWDGEKLSYKLLSSDMGGQYPDVTINAKVDWSRRRQCLLVPSPTPTAPSPSPPAKSTTPKSGGWVRGSSCALMASPNPRLKEDPNDDKVRLEFSKDKLVVVFSKPDKDDVRIDAEDLKIDEKTGTITFTHDLKPIGGEGKSSDTITLVQWRTARREHLARWFKARIRRPHRSERRRRRRRNSKGHPRKPRHTLRPLTAPTQHQRKTPSSSATSLSGPTTIHAAPKTCFENPPSGLPMQASSRTQPSCSQEASSKSSQAATPKIDSASAPMQS